MLPILETVEQARSDTSSTACLVSRLCSGTGTTIVTEYGFCCSSTKSSSFETFWLNVRRRVVLRACWRWHSVCFKVWLLVKVEEISDHPNLMEQELKLRYSICIVCGSYDSDFQDPLILAEWSARPSCHLPQHRTSQGDPAQPTAL
jgi:hypothetical protein